MKELLEIKIPIPSLERQKELVEYCDFNDDLIKQFEKEIENNKNQAKNCITSIVKSQILEEQYETKTNKVIEEETIIEDENIIE